MTKTNPKAPGSVTLVEMNGHLEENLQLARKVWNEDVLVTPEQAMEWLVNAKFEHQRPLREWHVDLCAAKMLAGKWSPGEQIKLCHLGDQAFLTDGQHRLNAVLKYGQPVWFCVRHMRVDSMDEVAQDYISTDSGVIRVLTDVYRAANLSGLFTMKADQVNKLGAAASYWQEGFSGGANAAAMRKDLDTKQQLMAKFAPSAKDLFNHLLGGDAMTARLTNRAAVHAVGVITCHYMPQEAGEFWRAVAKDEGFVKGDPQRTLLRFLQTNKPGGFNRLAYTRSVANCWNAYVAGRSLQSVCVPLPQSPISIKGTPFSGKRHLSAQDILEA